MSPSFQSTEAEIRELSLAMTVLFTKYGWEFSTRFDAPRNVAIFEAVSQASEGERSSVYAEVTLETLLHHDTSRMAVAEITEQLIKNLIEHNVKVIKEELDILDGHDAMMIVREEMDRINKHQPNFGEPPLTVNLDKINPQNADDFAVVKSYREYEETQRSGTLDKMQINAPFMWSRLYGRIPRRVLCSPKEVIDRFLLEVDRDYREMENIKQDWNGVEPGEREYEIEDRESGQKF